MWRTTGGRVITISWFSLWLGSFPGVGRAEESLYLYGIHDHDPGPQEFLDHLVAQGRTSWVTATVAIGSDPTDLGGDDFTGLVGPGHSVIVRLNNGYCPDGSIPPPSKYVDFARRAANYVRASRGAHIWVIGNETNLPWEWPVVNGRATYVSPQSYAQLFRLAYDEIKRVRPDDKVIPQALAPFAGPYGAGNVCNGLPHDGNSLNWVQYMNAMLTAVQSTGPLDGIALHINSRGYTYGAIHSTQKVTAAGQSLYFSFYVYKDWVDHGIPRTLYHLPLYATEANGIYYWQGGHPENPAAHYEPGWVQEIYAEINRYNQQAATTGKPIFRSVNLYRWCAWCDGWNIDGSTYEGQILADLDAAATEGYRWPESGNPSPGTPPGVKLVPVNWAASSIYSTAFGGDKAYDGVVSVSSKWTSNGATVESWLALDLGATHEVTGFIVRHAGAAGELSGYNTAAYRVESGSSLSGPWVALASVSNTAQQNVTTTILGSPVFTRFVRLYVTDAGIDNYARIPESEVYAADTSPPPAPGALVNGDFEASGPGTGPGAGWTAFASSGYPASFSVVSDPVHGGSLSQRVLSPQPTTPDQYAGVYQTVATEPGRAYFVRAWSGTSFPRGNAWDHIARLGIDLGGGADFVAPSVSWHEFNSAKEIWHRLEVPVTASGASMTVFLQSWRKWATGGDAQAWFDDVEVDADDPNRPPTAVAVAQPLTGTAPLTVSFSGAGSSDPDGDPLTFAWSFGDGLQAAGATVSHTYSAAGSFTATLTVSDGRGGSDQATRSITVAAPPPPTDLIVNGDLSGGLAGWSPWTQRGTIDRSVVNGQLQLQGGSHNGGVYQQFQTGGAGRAISLTGYWASEPTVAQNQWAEVLVINGSRLPVDGQDVHGNQSDVVLIYKNDTWASPGGWSGSMEQTAPVTNRGSFVAAANVATLVLKSGNLGGFTTGVRMDEIRSQATTPPANQPPTARMTASPTSGTAPLTVDFDGSSSTDPDGDPLTYTWSFGDGAQATGPTASHTYAASGSYTARLTVDDGRNGTHSASLTIAVSPASGNRPPQAVISANPRSATIPFTVTLDGSGSSDPDGDPLTYAWSFADGVQGSGPTLERTFVDDNADMRGAGGYLVTLTVSDGNGGSHSASLRIGVFPPGCPSSLDFDAIRAQLDAQGQDLEFVKIGFHTGGGGTFGGLGKWERCLDAAGVPFTVKEVPSAHNASAAEAARLKARSGVPHVAIFRRCCQEQGVVYELPACALQPGGWNNCTDDIAQQEATAHWERHRLRLPLDVVERQSVWVETINEPWKGDNTRNNAEWLAKFSYYTALAAMADGYNYAAFGWSSGEPEPGPPPYPLSPGYQWDGPEMQKFLRLAAQHPDRIAISLHEYNYGDPTLRDTYPSLVGRFQKLFERCDANNIPRPTVLVTEFGWPGTPPVEEVMSPDNVPWAAGLYAGHRQVKGAALWDQGDLSSHLSAMTAYALQNYFAIPKEGAPPLSQATLATSERR